jgi:TrkA domain protein
MATIKEAELPGLGKKFEVTLENGDIVSVIIHDEGTREVYHFSDGDEDPSSVVTLTDIESRQLGSIIGGAFYQPKMLEKLEAAVADLHIEWIEVKPDSEVAGKSIGDMRLRKDHGIIVVAAIEGKRDGKKARRGNTRINPGPSYIFTPGHTVVAAGTKEKMKLFEQMLDNNNDDEGEN